MGVQILRGTLCSHRAKTAEPIVMPFGLWARSGSRNHELDGGPDPPREAAILGKGSPIVKYGLSAVSCAETAQRSICRLGCGLRWADGSTSSIVFARWRQCALHVGTLAPSGKYDCGGDPVLCQITLTTCYRHY